MRPEWKDAPEWANYRAMDSNGEWFWYECSPEGGLEVWLVSEGDYAHAGRDSSWKETKEERPVSSTKENTAC